MSRGRTTTRAGASGWRKLTGRAGATLGLGIVSMATAGAIAVAAPPTAPSNLVVFPDRDFITVEGFQDRVGEVATIEVTRDGAVVGSARSTVAAGEVAFEINHPGGVCWGAGTAVNVTPDIVPGDKVTIKFDGDPHGDTTVQNTFVDTDTTLDETTRTLTVKGYIAGDVNQQRLEQRIVNPDLTDTDVGRRDVRALPGALVREDDNPYRSGLAVTGDRFTATYVFDTLETARIAASGGGERMMSWEVEDADGNRQGLTIAEYGEVGGPGMGGCPAGPAEQSAPQPGEASALRSSDKTQLQVAWTPAEPVPGADAVTGYNVVAIAETDAAVKPQLGVRTDESAEKATITGLDPAMTYTVEVRSLAGQKMSEPMTIADPVLVPGDNTPPENTELPTLTATPAPNGDTAVEANSVTLNTNGTDVYYTTDGSDVLTAGLPSDTAKLYTAAIPITEATTIKAVAFNAAGYYQTFEGKYTPTTTPPEPPAAPTELTGTPGQESVALRWTASDTSITGYGVQVYDAAGAKVGDLRETTVKNMTVTGLTAGVDYFFTVQAKNAGGYGAESAKAGPYKPLVVTDRVTITSARYEQGDEFRVGGTASLVGATITLYRANATNTGPDLTRPIPQATATVTQAPAPATGGLWQVRLRNGNTPATNPGVIWAKSSGGGVAGPFTVEDRS